MVYWIKILSQFNGLADKNTKSVNGLEDKNTKSV